MADREEYFISLSISLSEGVTLEQIARQRIEEFTSTLKKYIL